MSDSPPARHREPFQFSLGALFYLIFFLAVFLALAKWIDAKGWLYAFLVPYIAAWGFFYRGWHRTAQVMVLVAMCIFIVGLFVVRILWLAW